MQLLALLKISIDLFGCQCAGGDERARTADPLLAKQVLSQLSYIPWGTGEIHRAITDASPASPSACEERLRGRLSDLESLKSGKDRTKPWVRLLVHSNERNDDGFSPRAEPPADHFRDRSHAFGTITLRESDRYSSPT